MTAHFEPRTAEFAHPALTPRLEAVLDQLATAKEYAVRTACRPLGLCRGTGSLGDRRRDDCRSSLVIGDWLHRLGDGNHQARRPGSPFLSRSPPRFHRADLLRADGRGRGLLEFPCRRWDGQCFGRRYGARVALASIRKRRTCGSSFRGRSSPLGRGGSSALPGWAHRQATTAIHRRTRRPC